jgi:hypothetical protein
MAFITGGLEAGLKENPAKLKAAVVAKKQNSVFMVLNPLLLNPQRHVNQTRLTINA